MATLDERQGQADNQTSPEQPGTSVSYTQAQVDKLVKQREMKARSDALADFGRVKKAAEEATARLERIEREREEAELTSARDEPDKLAIIHARQQSRKSMTELERVKAELEEARVKLAELSIKDAETRKQAVVQEIASEYGVDSAMLAKLAKYTDSSPEAIEEIAQSLPRAQAEGSTPIVLRPDSNRSKGGAPLNKYEIMKNYSSGKMNTVQYAEAMKAAGFQP